MIGQVLHGHQTKRNGKRYAGQAPYETFPMQLLSLTRKPSHDLRHVFPAYYVLRKDHIVLLVVAELFSLQLTIQGWKTLQTPFLVRYALQTSVTVLGQGFLPTGFGSLPFCPCLRYLVDGFLHQTQLPSRTFIKPLAVDQCLSRRDGKEEDSHSRAPNLVGQRKACL